MINKIFIAAVVALFIYFLINRNVSVSNYSGDITLYGSHSCPWCIKQVDYLKNKQLSYRFVDCVSGQCPDFVQSYPTLVVNEVIYTGYTEI